MDWVNTDYIRVSEGQFFVHYAFYIVLRIEELIAFWPMIRLFCAILSVVIYFTEPLILCCYIINHKIYNFLGFDWFKKGLFSTNSLAKLLSDSDKLAVVRFCYHSYDYRPNWTPLSPITITNFFCSAL